MPLLVHPCYLLRRKGRVGGGGGGSRRWEQGPGGDNYDDASEGERREKIQIQEVHPPKCQQETIGITSLSAKVVLVAEKPGTCFERAASRTWHQRLQQGLNVTLGFLLEDGAGGIDLEVRQRRGCS